jgi:DNA transposition AAA+ family ATPase
MVCNHFSDVARSRFSKGSLRDLLARVQGTLKAYQVKLLLVDDAHILERQAMTELVKIFDDLRLPVVMAGINDLDRVLDYKGYEHIYNTFLEAYNFRALSESEVESVTSGWEEQVASFYS